MSFPPSTVGPDNRDRILAIETNRFVGHSETNRLTYTFDLRGPTTLGTLPQAAGSPIRNQVCEAFVQSAVPEVIVLAAPENIGVSCYLSTGYREGPQGSPHRNNRQEEINRG